MVLHKLSIDGNATVDPEGTAFYGVEIPETWEGKKQLTLRKLEDVLRECQDCQNEPLDPAVRGQRAVTAQNGREMRGTNEAENAGSANVQRPKFATSLSSLFSTSTMRSLQQDPQQHARHDRNFSGSWKVETEGTDSSRRLDADRDSHTPSTATAEEEYSSTK